MLELFLACALALPATHHMSDISSDDENRAKIEDLRKLRDFVERVHPGARIVIVPKNIAELNILEKGLERLPFTWGDKSIFIKRKPVYDKRTRESA